MALYSVTYYWWIIGSSFYWKIALSKDELPSTHQGTAFVISMLKNVWADDQANATLMRIFVNNFSSKKLNLHVEVEPFISYSTYIEPKMTNQIKVTPKLRHDGNGIYNAMHIATSGNVTVLVVGSGLSRDGFLAIPIEAFGMVYTIVTLVGQPVFHVLSTTDDTDVIIQFNDWATTDSSSYGEEFILRVGRKVVKPKSILTVSIKTRYQYFQLHDCGSARNSKTDLTGTRISSLSPIGVISGNCETSSKGEYHFTSHVEEMLFPMSTWGFHYYFLTPNSSVETRLRILAQSSTMVQIVTNSSQTVMELTREITHVQSFVESGVQVLVSSAVSICVVMFTAEITDYQSGDLGMVQIIPTENWLNWYYVSIPMVKDTDLKAELIILILSKDLPGLNIDFNSGRGYIGRHHKYREKLVSVIDTIPGFTAMVKELVDFNVHVVYHADGRTFGLYVRTVTPSGHLFVQGGAKYGNGKQFRKRCSSIQSYMYGEDEIDNDCDGLIDEETFNGLDDDYDYMVDEDLGIVNGSWSDWSKETYCSVRCRRSSGLLGFFRACTNPEPSKSGMQCDGKDFKPTEDSAEKCSTVNVKCPDECTNRTWYYGCERRCPEGCMDTCDAFTGRCRTCKPGYPLSNDYTCNMAFRDKDIALNILAKNMSEQKPAAGTNRAPSQAEEEITTPQLGWKIYATIIYIGVIIVLGIVWEVCKRYRKSLRCCRCKKRRKR